MHAAHKTLLLCAQSGLFVSGLIGVLAFHELKGREQVGYWLSGIVLIAGASMLACSK